MICQVYSVKDELNGTFHNPMFLTDSDFAENEAKRIFKSSLLGTPVWRDNPHDFTLYKVGGFDTKTGEFTNEKQEIINGSSVKE